MLDALKRLGAHELPVRYGATEVTLEYRIFRSLMERCQDNGYLPGTENTFEGVSLSHDPDGLAWVSLRQNDDRLVMTTFDLNTLDCIMVACTDLGWLSMIMMLYTPSD